MAVSLVFCGTRVTVGAGVSLILFPALRTFFLLLGCLTQHWYVRSCLVFIAFFFFFGHVWLLSLGGLFFLGEKQDEVHGRELGYGGSENCVVRMHCIRKKSILNKKIKLK